jgi:hypothetical protein
LETLARVEMSETMALLPLLQQQRFQLEWGTALILITGKAGDEVLNELYQARRAGQSAMLILTGMDAANAETLRRARTFNIPVFSIASERDLQIWMQRAQRV